MAFAAILSALCRQFRDMLWPDQRRHLIEVLRDEYGDEAKDVAQFQEHARRMTYPSFRERLLRIAEEEKAHVDWLGDKIRALGGTVPDTKLTVKNGKNSWECLRLDAEEEKRDYGSTLERVHTVAEQTDPEIAHGLRRIHEEEKRHRAEILDMLMKSDPQAALAGKIFEGSVGGNHI